MTRSPAVPFEHGRTENTGGSQGWGQTVTRVTGLAWLEDEAVVLQYRVSESITRAGSIGSENRESEVREHRIPLTALRSARVAVLAASDLRAFEGFPVPRKSGEELALRIALAHRADAADLASSIELALANRLYLPAV